MGTNLSSTFEKNTTHRLVAFDYGAKRAIYKNLRRFGFEVIVLPADASAEEAASHNPDAIFLSNGPGDPSALEYAHSTIQITPSGLSNIWNLPGSPNFNPRHRS